MIVAKMGWLVVLALCGCLFLGVTSGNYVAGGGDILYVEEDDTPVVRWIVPEQENNEVNMDNNMLKRRKRSVDPDQPELVRNNMSPIESKPIRLFSQIQPQICQDRLRRLCGVLEKEMNDLFYLECMQTFKVSWFLDREDE